MEHKTTTRIWTEGPVFNRESHARNICSCGWEGPLWLTWPKDSAKMEVEALRHRVSILEQKFEAVARAFPILDFLP